MKTTHQIKATSLVALALLANVSISNLKAGNLLVDPGLEHQTASTEGGWIAFGGVPSTDYSRSGQWSMFVATDFGVPVTFQQFPAAPGSKWQMTGFGLRPNWPEGALGLIQFTFFDALGHDLGTVETAGNQFPAKTSNGLDFGVPALIWTPMDTGTATAPAGTAYIQAFALFINFSGTYEGAYFDDMDLEVLGVTHGEYVASIIKNAQALKSAGLITGATALDMIKTAALSAGGRNE